MFEAREMKRLAEEKNLITQMGIQVHSFYDYKLATLLIQDGLIGKVTRLELGVQKIGIRWARPTGQDTV